MKSESAAPDSPKRQNNKIWLIPLAVIVLCGLSFWGGTAYEKGHVKSSASTPNFSRFEQGGVGRFNNGQRPNIGDVTAISASSITISNNFSGSSQTFSISGSTTFTNDGTSATVSDIQTGDRVLIRTSSSSSATATAIDINPSFGGGGQGQGS
jgi:hypothetical protein